MMYTSVLLCIAVLSVNQLSQTQAEFPTTSIPLNEETEISNNTVVCGPGKCEDNEVCVSWEKHCGTTKCEADIELEYHECFPKEGDHWDRMNPTAGGELCPHNETHEIIYHEQPCLKDEKPCNLLWRYKCVELTASPHSCTNKKCPQKMTCIENIQCDINPPCIMKSECFPCLSCNHISDKE